MSSFLTGAGNSYQADLYVTTLAPIELTSAHHGLGVVYQQPNKQSSTERQLTTGEENKDISGAGKQTLNTELDIGWLVWWTQGDSVELISDRPTEAQLKLKGPQCYNNGVYLLDILCREMYGTLELRNSGATIRNIKCTDIVGDSSSRAILKERRNIYKLPKLLGTTVESNSFLPAYCRQVSGENDGTVASWETPLSPVKDTGQAYRWIGAGVYGYGNVLSGKALDDFNYGAHYWMLTENIGNTCFWLSTRATYSYSSSYYFRNA